jgi:hypothetical protein
MDLLIELNYLQMQLSSLNSFEESDFTNSQFFDKFVLSENKLVKRGKC